MRISGSGRERGWGLFTEGWVGEVLHFVIEVWSELELPPSARLETRITKLLAGAIIDRYEREERDWFCSPESPDWNAEGKETSRTDIRLYPPGPKRRHISLVFEGKRLNLPTSNASAYVGADGIMSFIPVGAQAAKYAAGLPCAAMLGYVLDADLKRAHTAVSKAIAKKRAAILLAPGGEYQTSPLLKSHRWHGETRHVLPDGILVLYHLLLPVRWKDGGQ